MCMRNKLEFVNTIQKYLQILWRCSIKKKSQMPMKFYKIYNQLDIHRG